MTDDDTTTDEPIERTRREVLRSAGAVAGTPFGLGAAYRADRSFEDRSGDGIPDDLKRSESFHRRLEELFGSDFEGLETERRDFLVDVRYVGDVSIDDRVKTYIEDRFRDNGIHMQWLDYSTRYDEARFREAYGYNARTVLWSRRSFYRREIESDLRDVAFQLVVVPGSSEPGLEGTVYSPWMDYVINDWQDGWVNGMNVGNRALVGNRPSPRAQAELALHEIAHLVLCHDDDPSNRGVMGAAEEIDLTAGEWARLRDGLDAVRDTSGYDVALRRCLWTDHASSICSGCR